MNHDDDTRKRQGQGQGQEKKQGGRPATKFIERERTHPENRPEGGESHSGESSYEDPSREKKLPDPNWKEGPYTKRDKDKEEEGSGQ